jgi:hypothetical protein
MIKSVLPGIIIFLSSLIFCSNSYSQLESDEVAATAVPVGGVKTAHYDKCKGILYVNLQTSQDAANTRPIYKAYVYIKVGTQWKNMVTIRGEDARCCNNTCGAGMDAGLNWNNLNRPAYNSVVDATNHNNPCGYGGTNIDNLSGTIEAGHEKRRIAYYNGSVNNFSWFTYEDERLCENYDANLNLASYGAWFVGNPTPPEVNTAHGSGIGGNLVPMSVYPTTGVAWAMQFGVTNVPRAAIVGNNIQVRVYVNYRGYEGAWGSAAAADNWYETYEYAVSTQVPDAPLGLTASTNQCGQVTLNWSNPSQTWSGALNCTNVQNYNNVIYRDGVKIAVVAGTVSTYVDNAAALQRRQTYNYTVKTILWNEGSLGFRESSSSNVATGNMKMPPAQPSPFNASSDKCNTSIELTWSQPAGTAVNQYSFITSVHSATLSSSARSYTWTTNVARGTTYLTRLVALNDCGYPSDTASVNGLSPADPAVATSVNVTLNATSDTATITWLDNANNETKYQVQRQDNLGNVVLFDVNPNVTSYKDGGLVACRSYTYAIKAFNGCVQSGLVSASFTTPIIPPPNLTTTFDATKKLTCSKGYFSNRIELNWQNNNGQNIDIFKIYRKINGTAFDSTLVGTSAAGSGFYVDNTADARVYYKYTIIGVKFCNGTDILTNASEDIGFRNPTGNVSGHIEYNGGIALTGAKVIIQQAGANNGRSLQFASGDTLTLVNPSTLALGNQLRMEFWFKPTSYSASQNIVEKAGVFSFKHTGANYVALINVAGVNYSISVPESNFALNQWKHVSMQYLGDSSSFRLYANGLPIGNAVVPNGVISNVNNQVVMGGVNSTFLMDEFRLLTLAAPLDTTIYIDHARYLNTSVPGSKISLRFDENFGSNAYDGSSQSNVFNGNHFIKTSGVTWSLDIPSSVQLSYYGITDILGNYNVSGITYSSSGENFTIIPSYLIHSFTPNSRSVFIGDASTVFNNQDFIDNSSFAVSGDLFYKNTTCPVPDGLLKIDGLPVISNGAQVKTDANGNFSIQVPIGQHYISIEKFEQYMEDGRFPATGTYDFQNDLAGIHFIDSTRRSIVGRVVGGLVEAKKAPGMDRSKNNIGKTKIRIVSPIAGVPCFSAEVITDSLSGEYRFDVPPLQYRIDSVYVLNNKFVLTSSLTPSPFTNTNQLLDLRNAFSATTVVDTLFDSNGGVVSIDSVAFHKRHDMIYRITPTINVTDTLNNIFIGEDSISYNGTTSSIKPTGPGWGPFGFPVFMQDKKYAAKIHANEIYNNFDNSNKDTVRLSGNVLTTNALVDGTDPNSNIPLENGIAIYRFTCGSPNTSTNATNPVLDYTKSIQVNVVPSGAATVVWQPNPSVTPPIYHAYVLGQRIAGTGIATLGPEKVDFILRDPPGSGSNSSWSTGTSVSISKDYSRSTGSETNISTTLKMGTEQSVGFMVETEVEVDNSVALGINIVGTNASGHGWSETITSSYSVSTRDDADNVGAPADIFIGRSRNWLVGPTLNIELIDATQCATVGGCFGLTVSGKRMVKKAGYAIAPGDVKTRFSYTQEEIETVVIPTLESLRATKLAGSLYTSNIPSTHPNFGSNNDDKIWGASATTTTPEIYEAADANGPSYTYTGNVLSGSDTVRILNTQISLWKKALARNEREKIQCITNTGGILIDNFTLGSAIVTNSYSTDREANSTESWELSIGGAVNIQLGAVFGGIGAQFEESVSISETSGGEESKSTTNTSSFEYTLTDGDPGDIMSIDVYKSPEGTGNIFVTRGGYTMCPYEDAVVSHYYNPASPSDYIGSHTYNAAGYATIQLATVQREIPEISITPSNQFSIPSNQPAVYQLLLTNQSPLVVNNDIDFSIRVASSSNPDGAVVKIDGLNPSSTYNIPAGSSVVKTLTVERGPTEINYDSLMIIFSSACSEDIADTAYITAHFIPTCTELELTAPNNNWVFNNSLKDTANIIVSNYNYNYGAATDNSTIPPTQLGLNKIGVEFRPNSTNVWTEFNSFYKYPGIGEDTIPDNQVYSQYLWDIANMPDGAYELKTKSYCLNRDGSFSIVESPIHAGVIDRINPHPFGTPSPADGILDPNDDISIKFNEPIDIGSLTNFNFDVRGVINGGNSRQNESLNFDGVDDYAEVAAGASLQKRSFTFEFWAQLNGAGINQTVISQGTDVAQNLTIGFDASNRFTFSMGSQSVASVSPVASINNWHHYAAVYDYTAQTASLYVDGAIVNTGNTTINSDYNGQGKLVFGKLLPSNSNYFNGNLNDMRLWSKTRSVGEIVLNLNKDLSRNSSGLLYNWKMNEAEGLFTKDVIRSRDAVLYGTTWRVTPNGYAAQFDGVDDRIDINSSTISITPEMDFTLEFWFKSSQAGVATLFSNGKGDGLGSDSLYAWNIQKDAAGLIHVYHKGYDFVATDSSYFDGNWHHFSLILQRSANLSCYMDGNLQNSVQALSFRQMGGPYMYIGARGYYTGSVPAYDNHFNGQIDEFRFWNTARKAEQIKRDKQNRMLGDEYALLAFVPFESYTVSMGVPILGSSFRDYSAETTSVHTDSVFVRNGVLSVTQTPTIRLPRPVQSISYTYSVNNDEIIITPTTSPELIENVTIDITVKDVYDLRGNKMQSPKTWIAFINKNQVLWQDDALSFTKISDSVITFNTNILNIGGALKQYTIGGLPSWITTASTAGTISPNSAQNITFSIPAGTPIGEYSADITLTTDFGYDEILRINLTVVGDDPNWVFNPANFQYSMNIFGEIEIDGVIATSTSTKVAAFINNTLCGVANLTYLPAYDRYELFLNVYNNNITGDSIHFQVYDATTGVTFVNVTPDIMFVESEIMGNVNTPVTFAANSQVLLNIPLRSGWTWVSLPLNSGQLQHSNLLMANLINADNDVIRSADAYDQYASGLGWLGNISSSPQRFENNQSYKIKRATNDTLALTGLRIHPDSAAAAINVVPGWNWIGYVATKNTNVSTAMSNYSAITGDILKSQYEFAYYDNMTGWIGSLTTMRPGLGYMLKSTGTSTFNYPLSVYYGNALRIANQEDINKHFTFNPEGFEGTMSVIAQSNLCDQLKTNNVALAAFDSDNTLRGYAVPTYNENMKDYLYYLTVYGNTSGETLRLKYINLSDGSAILSDTAVIFSSDALLGTPGSPVQATVASDLSCLFDNLNADIVHAYPNPFSNSLEVEFKTNVNVTIELTDAFGKVYASVKSADSSNVKLDLGGMNLPDGVYVLKVRGDVNTTAKVIKVAY